MKTNKVYRFKGVNSETEWRFGLLAAAPTLLVLLGCLFLFKEIFNFHFILSFIIASVICVLMILFIIKKLSNQNKNLYWIISLANDDIDISFRDKNWKFQLKDIRIIKNMGNVGFRYLTIITKTDKIKIRVGNIALVPFSTDTDIIEVDNFIASLKPYIDENFNKKILKNRLDSNSIPNWGIFVDKKEKVKYSIINKMTPAQILIFFGISSFLMILLLMYLIINLLEQ